MRNACFPEIQEWLVLCRKAIVSRGDTRSNVLISDTRTTAHLGSIHKPENGKALHSLELGDIVVGLADGHRCPSILVSLGQAIKLDVPFATDGARVVNLVRTHLPDRREPDSFRLVTHRRVLGRLGCAAVGSDRTGSQRSSQVRLEVSLDVDLDGGRELVGVAKGEIAFVCLERLRLLDPRNGELINGLGDGGTDALVALGNQCFERFLSFSLEQ